MCNREWSQDNLICPDKKKGWARQMKREQRLTEKRNNVTGRMVVFEMCTAECWCSPWKKRHMSLVFKTLWNPLNLALFLSIKLKHFVVFFQCKQNQLVLLWHNPFKMVRGWGWDCNPPVMNHCTSTYPYPHWMGYRDLTSSLLTSIHWAQHSRNWGMSHGSHTGIRTSKWILGILGFWKWSSRHSLWMSGSRTFSWANYQQLRVLSTKCLQRCWNCGCI